MSAAMVIITLPLLAAVIVYLLRRWPLPSAALASAVALLLGLALWRWPYTGVTQFLQRSVQITQPVMVLGQQLQLQPTSQWVIGFLAIILAVVYVGTWQISPGRSFYPFGLVLLTLLSSVLLISPPWLSPLVLAAAMSFAALVVQAGRQGSTRGALRVLWWPVLVIPLFLLAAWNVDQAPLAPEDLAPLAAATQLASVGLLLLLAPWPLHGPALSLGEEAPPLVAAWLLCALALIAVTLLQGMLSGYPWLQSANVRIALVGIPLSKLLVWGGLVGCLWAGLGALVQRNLSRQWSYAAMFSYSTVLIAVGLGARSSWGLVWLLLLARSVGLLVSGLGLAGIRQRAGGFTDAQSVSGLATRLPWTSAALLLGGLSLAGLPLTAGFAGQWALVQALGSTDWLQAVIVLVGALGLAGGLLRSTRTLLGPLTNLLLERENQLMIVLAAVGLAAIVIPALFPSVWREILTAVVVAFSAAPTGF